MEQRGVLTARQSLELGVSVGVLTPPAHRALAERDRVLGQSELLDRAAAVGEAAGEGDGALCREQIRLEVQALDRQPRLADRASERGDAIVAQLVPLELDGVKALGEQRRGGGSVSRLGDRGGGGGVAPHLVEEQQLELAMADTTLTDG